jgi:hypothetical protein
MEFEIVRYWICNFKAISWICRYPSSDKQRYEIVPNPNTIAVWGKYLESDRFDRFVFVTPGVTLWLVGNHLIF